jgi:adenylate cyclase
MAAVTVPKSQSLRETQNPGEKKRALLRFPLALKLSLAVSALLVFSLGVIIFLVWFLVRADVRNTAMADNDSINYRVAAAAETMLEQIKTDTSLLLGSGAWKNLENQRSVDFFFVQNPEIAAVVSLGVEGFEGGYTLLNRTFTRSRGIDASLISAYLRLRGSRILEGGDVTEEQLFSAAPDFFGLPVLVLSFPYTGVQGLRSRALVFFLSEKLTDYFGFGANPSVMVNAGGEVVIHSDMDVLKQAVDFRNDPAVKLMRSGGEDHLVTSYREDVEGMVFASIRRLDFGGAMVLTTIAGNVVYEGINATTRRNGYFAIAVWFISLLLIRFFSMGLTRQLRILRGAAEEIEDGRYHGSIPVKTRDETGLLTQTMNSMSMALQSFEKFTNKEIARLTRKGLLVPGGVEKKAVFLFSDIRSFTAISSQMESAKVVELLNGYMDLMVACVMITGGVIDKFIGDAIMAHWGAVRAEQSVSDAGKTDVSEKKDVLAAVRTALMMRAVLQCFNQGRGEGENPIIKNGCGINSGTVVAGQIGTGDRLEYTVIGDAVKLADRIESFNKSFGTEILITEQSWRLVGEYLVTEELPSIVERGINIRLFAVVNLRDTGQIEQFFLELGKIPNIDMNTARYFVGTGGPHTLGELRSRLDIDEPDLSKVVTDEKKFKVLGQ